MIPIFTATIFLNALLLFLVQPMFGKMVLPLVGGTPAIWNTCLLFFQIALLVGYLYAHLAARKLAPRGVVIIHLALLAVAAFTLPIALPADLRPDVTSPTIWLLGLLAVTIGLPFTVLAAGSPLIQHLFARSGHEARHDPYFLYAASNVGSFGALLAYPLFMEPWLTLGAQSRVWTGGFVLLLALIAVAGFAALRGGGSATVVEPVRLPSEEGEQRGVWRERAWWLALSFVPNSLLLGVTTYITTDMAAVPLLWVLPLGLYLLSFVLAFSRFRGTWLTWARWLAPIGFLAMCAPLFIGNSPKGMALVGFPAFAFFIIALLCHGELYERRPNASRLTEFYLFISIGGVLGGAFNVLLAPVLFNRILELPIALALAAFLMPGKRAPFTATQRRLLLAFGVAMVYAVLERNTTSWEQNQTAVVILLVLVGAMFVVMRTHAILFGVSVFLVLLAADVRNLTAPGVMLRERNFFGEHLVRTFSSRGETLHFYTHGRTLHGAQQQDEEWRSTPISYYAPEGPVGEMFFLLHQNGQPRNVGVLGLGVGTSAAYARESDTLTFFEIDPMVERIARDTAYFSYLSGAVGTVNVILGDARLTIGDQPDGHYDVLIMDAFSSDAIPVHLITREAMELYFRKLKPDGIVLFHVSNRYMDLSVMLQAISRDLGLVARERFDSAPADSGAIANMRRISSHWTVVARDEARLERLSPVTWWPIMAKDNLRSWTDDFSNIISVLRLNDGFSRSRVLADRRDEEADESAAETPTERLDTLPTNPTPTASDSSPAAPADTALPLPERRDSLPAVLEPVIAVPPESYR